MNLLPSRGAKFLAAAAAVAAIGMGTGGWAFAASSGHGPHLTPAHRPGVIKLVPGKPGIKVSPAGGCSDLTLTPVAGAPTQPVPVIENPTPVSGTPVVCGDEGTTGG